MSTPPSPPNTATTKAPAAKGPGPVRSPLAELGMGAAWLVGLAAVSQIVALLFRSNPLAAVVVQAVVVDLAVGHAGVRWDPASDNVPAVKAGAAKASAPKVEGAAKAEGADGAAAVNAEPVAALPQNAPRGIGIGLAVAVAVAAVVLGVSVALGWAKVTLHAGGISMVFAALRSVAIGVRDALLYAGLPLFFVGRARGFPKVAAVVFGALAAGAALSLQSAATPSNVALAIAVSAATAAFWLRDGAGWSAVGVAAGWAFVTGVVLRGGLVDVDWKRGSLAPGLVADGAPAWLAAALMLAAAAAILRAPRAPAVTAAAAR